MAARTLILGAGFGGLTTASELRRLLGPDHEIVLVDRRDEFFMGLRKLWELAGTGTVADGRRRFERLADRSIRFIRGDITRIDPESRAAEVDDLVIDADHMVIALGAEPRPDLVPGLGDHAFNLYDAAAVGRAAERLATFEGGNVIVAIAGLPYKCPPAPYEATLLLDDRFRRSGSRRQVKLTFSTLQPILLPNAGPEGARWIGAEFTRRGIVHFVGRKVERIEDRRIVFHDGVAPFDVALIVPPHRAPEVVRQSPLADGGNWIPVDRGTLATKFPGVYAIGDVTHIPLANEAALPKAGVFAEAHGRRVAAAIAAELSGKAPPAPFDGRGYCFLEVSSEAAARVDGAFFAEPKPDLQINPPSPEALEAKREFERSRLVRWFGA